MPRTPRLAFRLPRLPRLSVRAMTGLVALVALTFGLAIELQNRQARDRNAAAEASARARAAWHRERAAECDAGLAAGQPYSFRSRVQLQRRAARTLGVEEDPVGLTGWAAERDAHRERCKRLDAEADGFARDKDYYRRRLIVPL